MLVTSGMIFNDSWAVPRRLPAVSMLQNLCCKPLARGLTSVSEECESPTCAAKRTEAVVFDSSHLVAGRQVCVAHGGGSIRCCFLAIGPRWSLAQQTVSPLRQASSAAPQLPALHLRCHRLRQHMTLSRIFLLPVHS